MKKHILKILIIFSFIVSSNLLFGQTKKAKYIPLNKIQWVDSVFTSLNSDAKISQLIMIRAHSNKTKEYEEQIAQQIKLNKVGGLCFFQGGPERQINLVNYYQKISKTPLLVAIDGEWGIGMRLDSVICFPRQLTLGAIQNDSLIYKMGQEVGRQCKNVGVKLNFAPDVDVNNNAANPVINSRSFGENPILVAKKATMYMQGMQSEGILSSAKHFPGHGDTDSDSHKTLPTVNASREELDSIHLYPFKQLINEGVSSIMVAHLFVPALDTTNRPSSLSPIIVTNLLKKELNFKGLVISDALEMKGVSAYYKPGQIEVMALKAGVDILLMPINTDTTISYIKQAFEDGSLDSNDIYTRVKKVLEYKYDAQLNIKNTQLQNKNIIEKINTDKAIALNKDLYRNALTLISNDNNLVPVTTDESKKVAIISIGAPSNNEFTTTIKNYRKVDLFSIKKEASSDDIQVIAQKLKKYDLVIMGVFGTNNSPSKNYGISQSTLDLATLINQNTKLIIDIHSNPYSVKNFIKATKDATILVSYEDNEYCNKIAAEALFGGSEISGKLPVSVNDTIKQGTGVLVKKKRLSICNPEEIGIKGEKLNKIDSIAKEGIKEGAYPGCQILIAKDGYIFYNKNFGTMTYNKKQKISDTTIYDLASITKVMATTMAVMKLSEEGKIDIDQPLKTYLPELKNTNKGNIIIRDLMAHQARLQAWIPFYLALLTDKKQNPEYLKTTPQKGFSIKVSDNLYLMDSYVDTIEKRITNSELLQTEKYKYSDLGMFYMKKIIEKQSGKPFDEYLNQYFYNPLGLQYTLFNPLNKFPKKQIAPTEIDDYFRFSTIQGTVHDQSSAMQGGIAGHAGLFSNTHDLAIICQMLLQKGNYGGVQYLDSSIITEFTRQQFPLNDNRRGLGFDKPIPQHEKGGPTCQQVSAQSFGHSGFTGTFFWIDPKYKIVYIFLSNRTFPNAENKKLIQMGIRTEIQKEIYNSLDIK